MVPDGGQLQVAVAAVYGRKTAKEDRRRGEDSETEREVEREGRKDRGMKWDAGSTDRTKRTSHGNEGRWGGSEIEKELAQ